MLYFLVLLVFCLGSIGFAKDDPEQKEKYDTLQCMKRYHKRYGKVRNQIDFVLDQEIDEVFVASLHNIWHLRVQSCIHLIPRKGFFASF